MLDGSVLEGGGGGGTPSRKISAVVVAGPKDMVGHPLPTGS
jgi:hypothetical protein